MPLGVPGPRSAAPSPSALRTRPRAWLACLALLACGPACGEDEPPPRAESAVKPRGRRPVTVTPEQAERMPDRTPPRSATPDDPYANPLANAPKPQEAAAAAAATQEKPRDYSAELLSGMRGSESCVKPRTASDALPSEVLISLEGLVLESGTVVSGAARAPVLTPEELECVKRRLESTRLPDEVKDAPRRVSATLKLTFKRDGEAAKGGGAAPAPAEKAPGTY